MSRIIIIHSIFLLMATSAWTSPDWPHPTLGRPLALRVDHAHLYQKDPAKSAKWIIPIEIKPEISKPGDVARNLELWLLSVVEFPKNSQIDKDDVAILQKSFAEAEWVDVYDDGVVGNAPRGYLVFPDTEDQDLAWIIEFWEKSVRLLPAKKCGENIYQSMIMGRSTALNGDAGVMLGALGLSLLK
jgi:hypothetical protein